MEKPIFRRIRKVVPDEPHGFPADEPNHLPEIIRLTVREVASQKMWINPRAPENFVGHPVPNARKTRLKQKGCLEGQFRMRLQKLIHPFQRKLSARDGKAQATPPARRLRSLIEADPSKLPHIGEDKGSVSLKQDQMVMFAGFEMLRGEQKLAGHSEMNSEPEFPGKPEEHLFATGGGIE